MARPISNTSVNRQDSDIIVKSIDQSPKICESMVQSRVQSTVQSSPVQSPGIVDTLSASASDDNKDILLVVGFNYNIYSCIAQKNSVQVYVHERHIGYSYPERIEIVKTSSDNYPYRSLSIYFL